MNSDSASPLGCVSVIVIGSLLWVGLIDLRLLRLRLLRLQELLPLFKAQCHARWCNEGLQHVIEHLCSLLLHLLVAFPSLSACGYRTFQLWYLQRTAPLAFDYSKRDLFEMCPKFSTFPPSHLYCSWNRQNNSVQGHGVRCGKKAMSHSDQVACLCMDLEPVQTRACEISLQVGCFAGCGHHLRLPLL
jgi:hypothetical protein